MYPLSAVVVIADSELSQVVQNCLRQARTRVVCEQAQILRWPEFLLQVERAHPDVVIVDLSQARLEETIRRIRTVSAAPVVVVHDAVDAETILGVIRAGAREYIYPPYEPGLLQALERIARERAEQESAKGANGNIVGVLSVKGGCGATTVACHLAAELLRVTRKEILLADLDMTAGVVGFVMNSKAQYSILDAAQNINRLDLSYWKALVSSGYGRVEVISAPIEPVMEANLDPDRYREVLRFLRCNYDWVIVDLGRGLSCFSLSLVEEMDQLFLVTHAEVPAFYQTKNVIQTIRRVGYSDERVRLVVNRAPKDSDFTISEVERLIGLSVHAKLPNSYPELYKAYAEGRLLGPDTQLGKQFTRLAMSLAGIPENKTGPAAPLFGMKKVAAGWGGL